MSKHKSDEPIPVAEAEDIVVLAEPGDGVAEAEVAPATAVSEAPSTKPAVNWWKPHVRENAVARAMAGHANSREPAITFGELGGVVYVTVRLEGSPPPGRRLAEEASEHATKWFALSTEIKEKAPAWRTVVEQLNEIAAERAKLVPMLGQLAEEKADLEKAEGNFSARVDRLGEIAVEQTRVRAKIEALDKMAAPLFVRQQELHDFILGTAAAVQEGEAERIRKRWEAARFTLGDLLSEHGQQALTDLWELSQFRARHAVIGDWGVFGELEAVKPFKPLPAPPPPPAPEPAPEPARQIPGWHGEPVYQFTPFNAPQPSLPVRLGEGLAAPWPNLTAEPLHQD